MAFKGSAVRSRLSPPDSPKSLAKKAASREAHSGPTQNQLKTNLKKSPIGTLERGSPGLLLPETGRLFDVSPEKFFGVPSQVFVPSARPMPRLENGGVR